MTTVAEAAAQAASEQAVKDMKKKRADAKPDMSLLHHIAATQVMRTGFTVTLLDGTTYKTPAGDFIFTDGLSIVHEDDRIYFPLTAIKSIQVHSPITNDRNKR
jgi:chaperone required for assembly of F1-ATPase